MFLPGILSSNRISLLKGCRLVSADLVSCKFPTANLSKTWPRSKFWPETLVTCLYFYSCLIRIWLTQCVKLNYRAAAQVHKNHSRLKTYIDATKPFRHVNHRVTRPKKRLIRVSRGDTINLTKLAVFLWDNYDFWTLDD